MAKKKDEPKLDDKKVDDAKVTPFDDETTSAPTDEKPPVELDITNPEHGNLTYEELQAGKLNKNPGLSYEEVQAKARKAAKKDEK